MCRIDQEWQYRIYCKSLKSKELNLLQNYLQRSTLTDTQQHTGSYEHVATGKYSWIQL